MSRNCSSRTTSQKKLISQVPYNALHLTDAVTLGGAYDWAQRDPELDCGSNKIKCTGKSTKIRLNS